ncbi:hypothetical protein CHS0354_028046 [Potamilus streckersoni]|uniref:Cadherin domain-containing protein n=1 Tax=Potamilus streckersoni TaxID=2493646 RepID=A0AAE0WDY0_9BIVA|nr:hypothetical protein CHS0354_028046 [Potamilus streckersoni]
MRSGALSAEISKYLIILGITGTTLFILRGNHTENTDNKMTFNTDSAATAEYINLIPTSNTQTAEANITLKKKLDRELVENFIELIFSLSDIHDTVYKTVRLYITDVCDEAPQFVRLSYTLEINETDVNQSTRVYTEVHATDKDNGNNAVVNYKMEPKTESLYWREKYMEKFSMNYSDGSLFLLKSLDFEENSFYQFTVYAHDPCNLTAQTPADLSIRVKDVQDQPPFFVGLPYMKSIKEGNYSNEPLLNVTAFDGDRGIPNAVEYFIDNRTACSSAPDLEACKFCYNLFAIDSLTGSITVTGYLDWERPEVQRAFGICTIIVEAKENDTNHATQKGATVSNTTVTLTIVDANNHGPKFANKSYTARIRENAAKNSPVTFDGDTTGIYVSDYDQGSNSQFIVKLSCESSSNCDTFEVVPATIIKDGILTIRVNNSFHLNYETRRNITITVIATDGIGKKHTDTATVVVQIENENEFAPVFRNETYEVWIKEGTANKTSVINVTATDEDRNGSDMISYSLSGGDNFFSVDNTTGEVVTNCDPKDLDREHVDKLYLRLTATDEGHRISQTQLIVNLEDVNDNPPIFQASRYTAILDENLGTFINQSFLTVKATDNDHPRTNNSKVSYEFRNISDFEQNFTIDSRNGEIRLASTLDYEALNNTLQGVINLTIFAYNDHNDQQMVGNATITIFIQDLNDNVPQFSQNMYYGTVKETARPGASVAEINAKDADATYKNSEISFAIEPGRVDFQINSSTGIVSVGPGANFDRDAMNSYNLTIIAIDHGAYPHTATTTLKVTIEDVNNKSPRFQMPNYAVEVHEDMPVGSLVINCNANDTDENASLRYIITINKEKKRQGQSFEVLFKQSYIGINELNGSLYVLSLLDREAVAELELTVIVNDTLAEGNQTQTDTATVNITVLDVDDNPPRFTHGNGLRVGMRRTIELGKEIFELRGYVTDEDLPQNAINKWIFNTSSFKMTRDLEKTLTDKDRGNRCDDPICVNSDGTIVNNMYYTQDMSGFFNVTVLVKDDAGNDTTHILIFLVADAQVLKMTLYGSRTNVALIKDTVLSDCSNVTGLLFVYDSIADHKTDDGAVETFKTDLFFHIQDHKNNKVLSAEEAKRLLDEYADNLYYARMKHNIVSIESSLKYGPSDDDSTKTTYVMAAVIALLALVVLIVGYMFFSSSNRYKRKLRAAMPPEKEINIKQKDEFITPGSNMYAYKENPLLNTLYAPPIYEEVDAKSHNSLDTNDVDDAKLSPKGELEEREVTLDMYGEDNCVSKLTEDPLEAALREHDAQKQASIHKVGRSRVGHGENEDNEEQMVTGFINNGFHHDLELETSEI